MTQNFVTLSGRIAFEPKVFETKSGGKIANIVLNVYDGKGKDDKPKYFGMNVKTFDKDIAESFVNLGKGSDIVVLGKLSEDTYEKDGKTVRTNVVIATYAGVQA